jgi:cell division protein YceG involved in septum cleavage
MQHDQYQSFADHVDEEIEEQEISGQASPEMGDPRANGHHQKQEGGVYYKFSVSRQSVQETGRQVLKAGETALQTGLAVDDLMERRRQAKRQVKRQNMSDGLRLVGFLADVFL